MVQNMRIFDSCIISFNHVTRGQIVEMAGKSGDVIIPRTGEIIEIANEGSFMVQNVGHKLGDTWRYDITVLLDDVA